MTRAGTPATSVRGATLVVTTLPAPTQLSRPIVTPGIRIERAPIHTLSSTMIGCDGGRRDSLRGRV